MSVSKPINRILANVERAQLADLRQLPHLNICTKTALSRAGSSWNCRASSALPGGALPFPSANHFLLPPPPSKCVGPESTGSPSVHCMSGLHTVYITVVANGSSLDQDLFFSFCLFFSLNIGKIRMKNFQCKEITTVSYESGYDKKILRKSRENKNERDKWQSTSLTLISHLLLIGFLNTFLNF